MSGRIFISYRRSDSGGHAHRLHDRLSSWFDVDHELFLDAGNIESGEDFRNRITISLELASVVLVLIGRDWIDELNRHVEMPDSIDYVRREVARALERRRAGHELTVIPVLLNGAAIPSASALVEPLRAELADLFSIDVHALTGGKLDDWDHQFVRLRTRIEKAPAAPKARFRVRPGAPRPWKVIEQSRSEHFQDPNGLLDALLRRLQGDGGTAAVVGSRGTHAAALNGMGGIGKTQLALVYSLTYRDRYAGVWWFNAQTEGGQGDSLLQRDAVAACAAVGEAVPKETQPSEVFKQWLARQTAPWLLVFDNADDPDVLRPFLPAPGLHHVIVTSRRPDWGGMARSVELPFWTDAQGVAFFRSWLGDSVPMADAESLNRLLGGLPLALEQAAAYMQSAGKTVAQYLGLWKSTAARLLEKHSVHSGYERAVAHTISLAFDQLSPAARQLLCLCAFAAPEPLPERFIVESKAELPTELSQAAADPLDWDDVASELRRYALVRRELIPSLDRPSGGGGQSNASDAPVESAITMHRLTQQVVRHRLIDSSRDWLALNNLLEAATPHVAENPRWWSRVFMLQPHALALAEYYNDRASSDKTGSPHDRKRLRLARECFGRGRPHQAMRILMPISDAHSLQRFDPLEVYRQTISRLDSISYYERMRLHVAVANIGRGRLHFARRILSSISEVGERHSLFGHFVEYYLGLLEHIAGSHALAEWKYELALTGFNEIGRTREMALVLIKQARLFLVLNHVSSDMARSRSDQSIEIALQGKHEDLTHIAKISQVRILSKLGQQVTPQVFRTLQAAQLYATQMEMPHISCEVHELRAWLLFKQGEYSKAATEANVSLKLAETYDMRLFRARAMLTLANICHSRGDLPEALALASGGRSVAVSADYYSCVKGFARLIGSLDECQDSGDSLPAS